ncbi:MAG: copper amine oxidase N-terminal domain-containing protein [Clostridia bacterium]|nr:copper amine oxidase N-terminal domain-containing protein [Clostridia bacterium]
MFKRVTAVLLLIAFVLSLSLTAFANTEQVDVYDKEKNLTRSVVFSIGLDEYFVDGNTNGIKMDAKPFIENGRTFVPVRYLGNALGVTDEFIGWESPKVTFKEPGFPKVELSVGKKEIKSDGTAKSMDTAPLLRSGRTYLPARFVAEALGYEVDWDADNKVVVCWPAGTDKPDVSNVVDHIKGEQPKEEPKPIQPGLPKGDPDELIAKAKPFDGKPFDFGKYDVYDLYKNRNLKGADAMHVTVNDFGANGIRLGDRTVIHSVEVTPEGIITTTTSLGNMGPETYLVEEGNLVRYHIQPALMGQPTKTYLTEPQYIYALDSNDNRLSQPDLTKMPQIILKAPGGYALIIDNPIYKGN